MRKANYDKFPSTKLTGMLVQGWDSIISMLKEKMDARSAGCFFKRILRKSDECT